MSQGYGKKISTFTVSMTMLEGCERPFYTCICETRLFTSHCAHHGVGWKPPWFIPCLYLFCINVPLQPSPPSLPTQVEGSLSLEVFPCMSTVRGHQLSIPVVLDSASLFLPLTYLNRVVFRTSVLVSVVSLLHIFCCCVTLVFNLTVFKNRPFFVLLQKKRSSLKSQWFPFPLGLKSCLKVYFYWSL